MPSVSFDVDEEEEEIRKAVMSQEQKYWNCVIAALQDVMTIAAIAEAIGVEDRQVWRWKKGDDRPSGLNALNLYLLHVKRCPERQCPIRHSEDAEQ